MTSGMLIGQEADSARLQCTTICSLFGDIMTVEGTYASPASGVDSRAVDKALQCSMS